MASIACLSCAAGAACARSMRSSRSVNLANWALELRAPLSTLDLSEESSVRRLAIVSCSLVRSSAAERRVGGRRAARSRQRRARRPLRRPTPRTRREAASKANRLARETGGTCLGNRGAPLQRRNECAGCGCGRGCDGLRPASWLRRPSSPLRPACGDLDRLSAFRPVSAPRSPGQRRALCRRLDLRRLGKARLICCSEVPAGAAERATPRKISAAADRSLFGVLTLRSWQFPFVVDELETTAVTKVLRAAGALPLWGFRRQRWTASSR